MDAGFQIPQVNQPISIAIVRSSDGVVVAGDIGNVSATLNPSFSFVSGAVMQGWLESEVHCRNIMNPAALYWTFDLATNQ